MDTVIILLILGAAAGAFYYYSETQAMKDAFKTTLPAAQIVRQAVQTVGSQRRWTATGHSSDFASFAFKQHANCGIALFLCIFGLFPGVFYYVIAERTESLNISVFPEPDGQTTVQVSSSGGNSKREGRKFLRGLPDAPAVAGAAGTHQMPPPPPPPPTLQG